MKISTSTAFFWGSVLSISMAGALTYRARVEIPNQIAIEQIGDQRDINRFNNDIHSYRNILERRVDHVYQNASLLMSLKDDVDWTPALLGFAKIAGWEGLDFFIMADQGGKNLSYHEGEFAQQNHTPPSAKVAEEVFKTIEPQLKIDETSSGFLMSRSHGPMVYAAGMTQWGSTELPEIFIAILRLTPEVISRFSQRLDLNVSLLGSRSELEQELERFNTPLGKRSTEDTLYSIFYGGDEQELLYLRFDTDPRNFEDSAFSTQILGFLIFFLVSLGLILALMYREILSPINRLAAKMRHIRQHNNYDGILHYRHNDEVGKLVAECNELLRHVKEHTQQLETISYTDALTGIGNRRLFQERLNYQWDLAQRKELAVILIMFDLDFFKQYNDTYGHDAGDLALQKFARLLREVFARDSDVVCRTGGEEFSVLLMAQPVSSIESLILKLIKMLHKEQIEHQGSPSKEKILTCSAGLCRLIPNADMSPSTLINNTDKALYKAKHEGRDQLQIFTP